MKILVVENDADIRECLYDVLSEFYLVDTVGDGPAALQALRADPYQYGLILVDLIMPKMYGCEMLRELTKIGIRIPVVVMSAAQRPKCMVLPWLQKPFDISTLYEIVEQNLDRNPDPVAATL